MQTEVPQNNLLPAFVMHYDGLVDYIRRHFGSYNFAADVVHDVCIQLIEHPPAHKISVPLAFFRKATVNRAIDRSRHEKVCLTYAENTYREEDIHYFDGESALEFVQKIDQVKKIIDSLPDKQRQVFLLHQLHEIPQHQIAVEMGITPNMVTKHFNKAITSITSAWNRLSK